MDPNQNKPNGDKPQDGKQPKWNILVTLARMQLTLLETDL